MGDADETLTATVLPATATDKTVTWETSAPGVASVSNGVVSFVGAGSATITAKTVNNLTATCSVTVAAATSPTATVSEVALDFGDVEVGQTKDLTFTITPANLTGDLTIGCDNGKYALSATSIPQATTTEQTITVTAKPTTLADNMDGIITISGGGITTKTVMLSATPYQVANVTLSATNGNIQEGGETKTSLTSRVGSSVTLTAVAAAGYMFESWSATGATPTSSTNATTEFTLNATDVTITANFAVDPNLYATLTGENIGGMTGDNGYGNVKTITVEGLTWSQDGYRQSSTDKYIQVKAVSSGSPYIKLPEFSGNIQNITFTVTNASATSKTGTAPSTAFKFRTTANGSDIKSADNDGNSLTIDLSALDTKYSTGYVVSSAGARIWDITVAYIPTDFAVSVGDVKYATFSDHLSRDFSGTGITPYTAKVDEEKVVLTKVADGIVPANTGVILYSESGATDKDIPFTKAATTTDFSENELVGVNVDTTVKYNPESGVYNYILQKSGSSIVFNKATSTGAKLRAHRAYLSTTYDVTAVGAPALEVVIGGENGDDNTTGISEKVTVDSSEASAPVYNLNGQRVSQPTKGLYIVNGKKVILK